MFGIPPSLHHKPSPIHLPNIFVSTTWSVVLIASTSPRSILIVHLLGPHPWPTESEALSVAPRNLHFNKTSRQFLWSWSLRNKLSSLTQCLLSFSPFFLAPPSTHHCKHLKLGPCVLYLGLLLPSNQKWTSSESQQDIRRYSQKNNEVNNQEWSRVLFIREYLLFNYVLKKKKIVLKKVEVRGICLCRHLEKGLYSKPENNLKFSIAHHWLLSETLSHPPVESLT